MLDFFLVTIGGPKRAKLKVKNPERYHFDAPKLLIKIVDIYLNFSDSEIFLDAVVKDGRSFDPTVFQSTVQLLGQHDNKAERVGCFSEVVTKLAEKAQEYAANEQELGEIPDE